MSFVSNSNLRFLLLFYRMNFLSCPSIGTMLGKIPLLGKIMRITILLTKIAAKLIDIGGTLIKLQKKATGSTLAAIVAALIAVGSALVAVAAATAKPEPITRTALVIAAISAIVTAIATINHVIDVIKANEDIQIMRDEMRDLIKEREELNNLLDDLTRKFRQHA